MCIGVWWLTMLFQVKEKAETCSLRDDPSVPADHAVERESVLP